MKYTGRLAMTLFVIVNCIGFFFLLNYNLILYCLLEAAVFVLLGWLIGLQYDKAKYFSERDSLTGMYNRRFVYRVFSEMCSLADRNQKSVACLMLDVNNFKTINDQYGHTTGDMVLKNISLLLMEFTRKSDIVARWGGDEFLLIVPFIDRPGTDAMITRLHESLDELSQNHQTRTAVSIGAAMYPDDASALDELIKIADQGLYQGKSKI